MTALQKSMLSLLHCKQGHFTAENILKELRIEYPSTSLATVYRNLGIFTREDQIRKIEIGDGKSVYEGNLIPHEHAICSKCGKILDFTIPDLSKLIEENVKGRIIGVDVNVKYICEECQSSGSNGV